MKNFLVKNQAIIVLSNLMDKFGNLNYESKKRAHLAYDILKKNRVNILITSGWNYREDSSICIADAFKKFFIEEKNLRKETIYCERNSRDTVGDAIFSRLYAYERFNFNKLTVITSDYHLSRTKEIFKFIYNSSLELEFFGTKTDKKSLNLNSEIDSLISFRNTFQNVKKGDLNHILETLVLKHPYYNGKLFEKINI